MSSDINVQKLTIILALQTSSAVITLFEKLR